ncbi:hypothetical protein EVAR_37241_1 [Eumeta japonica]|uniref:Uncharacterized protein n=1 Tax=Eumeta variegata TaxID=151549 RepID=A0A4C1Y5H1_EUMVA|nr:hypothetical protein EVAR_37241_1 [Eumeta japonica]
MFLNKLSNGIPYHGINEKKSLHYFTNSGGSGGDGDDEAGSGVRAATTAGWWSRLAARSAGPAVRVVDRRRGHRVKHLANNDSEWRVGESGEIRRRESLRAPRPAPRACSAACAPFASVPHTPHHFA